MNREARSVTVFSSGRAACHWKSGAALIGGEPERDSDGLRFNQLFKSSLSGEGADVPTLTLKPDVVGELYFFGIRDFA